MVKKKNKSKSIPSSATETNLAEGNIAQKKSTTYKKIVCTIGIVLISFIALIAYCIYNRKDPFCNKILETYKNSRSVTFIVLGVLGIFLLDFILFWKSARKLGLCILYFLIAITLAILGQVHDYVTRSDTVNKTDIGGYTFGDYGFVSEYGYSEK